MNNSKVLLKVEDFRAIGKAEIKLDGITVVAGVNGCGKSTLSKLLYWVYRGSTDFKVLADSQLKKDLEIINKLFILFVQTVQHNFLEDHHSNNVSAENIDDKVQNLSYMAEVMTVMAEWYELFKNKDTTKDNLIEFFNDARNKLQSITNHHYTPENLIKIFYDIFKENHIVKKDIEKLKNLNIFDFLTYLTNRFFDEYDKNLSIKPRLFLDRKIQEVFHTQNLPQLLEIAENNLPIFITSNEYINSPYWIDNVIYIDTPMFFQNSGTEYWNDVNEKLKIRPELYQQKSTIAEIDDLIKKEVLIGNAEIKFDELSGSFIFKTSSGAEIDLSDSATGIKAFAVLNLLLKNKSINDKTLLILDEPEAHLHPQWVIEFGRLLTLIHKYIGAKVFVATHSPDMVQALRYIPNKEGIGERVNFYLAKADDNKNGQFIYQDLKGEIDDIFSSFNISLDKLAKYGED